MSIKTDLFEKDLAQSIYHVFQKDHNFSVIPRWFVNKYGNPPYDISKIRVIGGDLGKTDILVEFKNITEPLKISAKMSNADYWGNWYSHTRVVNEFGMTSFNKIVEDCTNWANEWLYNTNASLFIGVSVSFGRRSGNTSRQLGDILTVDDVMSIIKGNFENPSLNANATYISDKIPSNFNELFSNLNPITHETIISSGILTNMKIIYRPINPLTEGTNRGKCIYTKYQPHQKFNSNVTISTVKELQKYGKFYPVTYNSLNHNRQIKELFNQYNVTIPVKR